MQTLKISNPPTMPKILEEIFALFGTYDIPVCVYGGFLRDLIVLQDNGLSQDIDIRLPLDDWCEKLPREFRSSFLLNPAHQRFLERMIHAGKIPTNPAFVYRVNSFIEEKYLDPVFYQPEYPPLELVLMQDFVPATQDAPNADIGLCQIAADGSDFWVTEAFLRDQHDKTLTVVRCRDERDAWRTLKRIERFKAGAYADYRDVWPIEAAEMRDAAIAEHAERENA